MTPADTTFRLLVASVKDYAIFMLEPDGRIATWNAGAEAIKGYSAAEAIGRSMAIFYTPEDLALDKPRKLLERALADGRVEDEGWRVRKDGTRFWADVVITALRDGDDKLVGFGKVTRDLTARRRLEQDLRASEALLAATLMSIGDAVLATDEHARVTLINGVAERLTGWSRQQALGRPIDDVFDIINEDTRAKAQNPVERVLREGIVVGLANHTALVARDGKEWPIADSGAPIRDQTGATRGAVLVFRDVSEERKAEDALRQSEERLRLMIASVRDYAIFMLDAEGRVISWNTGAESINGYREDEILGSDFARFFPPEDIAAGKPARMLGAALASGRFEDEGWRVRKDGTRFWVSGVISAVRDSTGRLIGFAKVTRDLTQLKTMEEERMRLLQAEEAVRLRDEFLSIASHELRTPLTALQLHVQGALDRVSGGNDKAAARLEKAVRSGQRLAELIDRLLDVSRIASGRLTLNVESFDVVDAARDVLESVRDAAARAGCSLSLVADAPVVGSWDRLRIEQILTNLLSNAITYAAGAAIEVAVTRDAGTAVLEVRDHGPGMPRSTLSRIFGRFERADTRNHGGLGLGLYIARQIAEAHGGSVAADTPADGGASFIVRLPIVRERRATPS